MKILIFILIFITMSYSYIDLGKEGTTYKVAEYDMYKFMKKRMNDLNITKIKNELSQSVMDKITSNIVLPKCKENKTYSKKNIKRFKSDVYDLHGNIIHKKNDIIEEDNSVKLIKKDFSVCLISGKNKIILSKSLTLFDKKKCFYVGTNINLLKWNDTYGLSKRFFPLDKFAKDSLNVKCTPTLIEYKDDMIYYNEYRVEEEL
jgi:hypothetical protein